MNISAVTNAETLLDIQSLWKVIKKVDRFDQHSTVESQPDFQKWKIDSVLVARAEGDKLVGYGVLVRNWQEKDGTHVYLVDVEVLPEYRGQGLEQNLLEATEKLCANKADQSEKSVIGVNATKAEKHKLSLYENAGYKEVIRLVEMELKLDQGLIDQLQKQIVELSYTVRLPDESEYQSVYEMIFKTQTKGTIGETEPSEADYQNFLAKETKYLNLGTFVWDGDNIIGQVTVTLDSNKAEILEVGVLPEYWRKGIATQMVLRTLVKIFEANQRRIRLHTDAYDRYGAKSMYQKVGFEVLDESIRLRKSMKEEVRETSSSFDPL